MTDQTRLIEGLKAFSESLDDVRFGAEIRLLRDTIAALSSPPFNACKAQKVEQKSGLPQIIAMLACDVKSATEKSPPFKAVPLSALETIFKGKVLVDAPAASVEPTPHNGEVEMSNSATKVAISILRARAAAFDDESDEQQAVQCRQTAQDLENELYAATGIFADLKAQVEHWQNRSIDLENQRTDAVLNYRALFNTYTLQTADVEALRAEIARLSAALELSGKPNLALADEIGESLVEDEGHLLPTAGSKRAICYAVGSGVIALRKQLGQEPDFKDQYVITQYIKELTALQTKYLPSQDDDWFYEGPR